MAEAGAVVYVRRAQQAGQLLHEVIVLIAALGGGEKTEAPRAVLFPGLAQAFSHQIQGLRPGDPGPALASSLEGRGEPVRVV